MKKRKPRVIVVGPGSGHNLGLALYNLAKSNHLDVSYFGAFYHNRNHSPRIEIYNYKSRFSALQWTLRVVKSIFIPKADVLYILGNMVPYDYYLLTFFRKYRKIIYNVWSQYNFVDKANLPTFQQKLFEKSDIVQCNWYETADIFNTMYPEYSQKTIVFPWGMSFIWESMQRQHPPHPFTLEFLSKLAPFKHKFINMRSISPYNAIEEFLEGITLFRKKSPERFEESLFVFWSGNNVSKNIENYILNYIDKHNLNKNVWYVEHPFLSNADISLILSSFDVVVNLVRHDQLSTSIIEAMVFRKELLCSDIPPYANLNKRYGLNVPLTKLNPENIAQKIHELTTHDNNNNITNEVLNKREAWVKENLSTDRFLLNIETVIATLLSVEG